MFDCYVAVVLLARHGDSGPQQEDLCRHGHRVRVVCRRGAAPAHGLLRAELEVPGDRPVCPQHRTLLLLVVSTQHKRPALVYDNIPSTTAEFSYSIGSRKLSANEQFFVGAQTVVSLLQTTEIISDVCFITDHVAYANSNKTKIV